MAILVLIFLKKKFIFDLKQNIANLNSPAFSKSNLIKNLNILNLKHFESKYLLLNN